MNGPTVPGVYERIVSDALRRRIDELSVEFFSATEPLDPAVSARQLSRHFQGLLEKALQRFPTTPGGLAAQVAFCNRLLLILDEPRAGGGETLQPDLLTPEMLLALVARTPFVPPQVPLRPTFPLTETHLLTNARGERRVGFELAREIQSADHIDLICSFLFWGGHIVVRPALVEFFRRKGGRMRVITSTYQGVTQPRVLDDLVDLGAEVRVSFDTSTTRLHAKAWLFARDSGYSTAFVGSSNLSAPALTSGLEWNVRVGSDSLSVIEKFRATFEGYWNDPSFEPYATSADRDKFVAALDRAGNKSGSSQFFFDLHPRPFQEAILERLQAERDDHGRRRNLVVAATGTGKTMVAAFDFKRLRQEFLKTSNRPPRLLFVAHRRELLVQARATFAQVLRDANFGELLVGGDRPSQASAVFASIQSLANIDLGTIEPSAWDVVIIDEFHRAEAPTYRKLLEHLRPWTMLGLTATPERGDGKDVFHWFDNHVAVSLRLWDAIEQGLLAPFQYFGLKDSADLSGYWKRGKLDLAELDAVLTGHHARAQQVLRAVRDHVADPKKMRAIGFCVGIGHAKFMADQFNRAGLRSETVLGDDSSRQERIDRLESGDLQALFTVDVLSEGIDIPSLDTTLFLRPTESPVVFIQQLGRGLRQREGKRCLTVLDLVASPGREFPLEKRYQALLGGASRRSVEKQVEQGFPVLPAGCSIQLTDDARAEVLESLRRSVSNRRQTLIELVRTLGANASLKTVLEEAGLTLLEFYRGRTLGELRRSAGFDLEGEQDVDLERGIRRLIGFDDLVAIREVAADLELVNPPPMSVAWIMVLVGLLGSTAFEQPEVSLKRLWKSESCRRELKELLAIVAEESEFPQLPHPRPSVPLRVHARYQRRQIEAAIAYGTEPKLPPGRDGVWYCESKKLDLFYVQLNKSERDFSPSTMYKDYAQSLDRFHWQSQATTAAHHKRARRNIEHRTLGITPLLFARVDEKDERGETSPYLFLGPLRYVSHEGERPLNIVWELETPMPASFFEAARVAI